MVTSSPNTTSRAAIAAAAPVETNFLKTGLDMLANFNFSQIGDALKAVVKSPITAVEDIANVLASGATIAGLPFAGTAQALLPVAENLINLVTHTNAVAGGISGAVAQAATAISSPQALAITAAPVPIEVKQGGTASSSSGTTIQTDELTVGLDILRNLNFAQISDALGELSTSPMTALEDFAEAVIKAAAVAGNPIANELETALPWAEKIFGFMNIFVPAAGGTTSQAAKTATAISSPRWFSLPRAI